MAKKTNAAETDQPSAPAVKTQSKAKFCSVGSKLPMSLVLQLCTMQSKSVSGQHGPVTEKFMIPAGESYVVRGNSYPNGQPPKGFPRRPEIIGDDPALEGYAVTKSIPLEFMQKWLEQNKDTDMVRNGVIKMQPDFDSLVDDAADFATLDSGLGPINPEHDEKTGRPLDRRSPKPINPAVSYIKEEPRTLSA